MFDMFTKWKLKKALEKKAKRSISDSYIETQRSIYAKRTNQDTSTIDVLNYMILNNILDLSTNSSLHSGSKNHSDSNSSRNSDSDNCESRYTGGSSHYCGGGGGSSDYGGGSSGGSSD